MHESCYTVVGDTIVIGAVIGVAVAQVAIVEGVIVKGTVVESTIIEGPVVATSSKALMLRHHWRLCLVRHHGDIQKRSSDDKCTPKGVLSIHALLSFPSSNSP